MVANRVLLSQSLEGVTLVKGTQRKFSLREVWSVPTLTGLSDSYIKAKKKEETRKKYFKCLV